MSTIPRARTLDGNAFTRCTAIALLLTTLAAFVALAVVPGTAAHAETYNVSIKNFSFNPQDLTIPVGSTVVWSNDETDGSVHSATADDGSFSQDLNPGDKFSWTFSHPGTFGIHCRFHTYITGTITVTDGSSSSTTSTTSPPSSTTTSTTSPPASTTTTSTTAPPSSTTSTTASPSSTTSTSEPSSSTTSTTSTPTTEPQSTTTTTSAPSTTTTSTTTPSSGDDTILGGTVLPPIDSAISTVLSKAHDAIVGIGHLLFSL